MPFKYKKKDSTRNKSKLEISVIKNALDDIVKGKSIRGAALEYGIDRNTLRNYLRDRNKLTKISEKGSQYKTSQIFTIEEENALVNYLLTCSKMNYGLTKKAAMKLACEYAKINSKNVPQSWTTNDCTGKDWFRGFMQRHPQLSLRTPEATSLSRSTSFNRKNLTDFFKNLEHVREEYQFEAHNIYNCDETGCTTVQVCPKVIASKHVRQVGQVTSAERGTLVTVCFAVNALGNVIPPFFVFPRVKYNETFINGGPPGSQGDSYPSGWMTTKSFMKYMQHFVKYSNASLQNRVLLILDNHESHVNIEVVQYAKLNGVVMLTLPPHCSNKLQPLDVAIYSSFKARYNTAMNNWMLSNPGRTVTIYNIPSFVSTIMSQAFSQSNILSGFRKTGIHPYNPNIFTDEDFLCSAVTDKEMTGELQDLEASSADSSLIAPQLDPDVTMIESASTSTVQRQSEPSTTADADVFDIAEQSAETASTSQLLDITTVHSDSPKTNTVLPEIIRPFPKSAPRKNIRRGRQPGKTKILTKTPEKQDLINNHELKNKKMKVTKTNQRGKAKKKTFTRQILQSSDSETDLEEDPKYDDSSDDPCDEDNWFCFVCGTDEKIAMRLCAICGKYVHEMCVGLTKDDKEKFICHRCSN